MGGQAISTRYDVSGVKPQGGYIAKKCPVVIQNRVLVPELEAPPDVAARRRMDQGIEFEDALLAEFSEGDGGHLVLGGSLSKPELIALTVTAMEEGVPFIWGGFLPVDELGRRTGKPDLLVKHGDGYLPVDVKHHKTLDEKDGSFALVSDLVEPTFANAQKLEGFVLHGNKDDSLQLAHYHRMLQACGFASGTAWAAIVGKEGLAVWYDLAEPRWRTPSTSGQRKTKKRSPLEAYDHEFGFRLDIAAVAATHQTDSSIQLLVDPVRVSQCGTCGFNDVCAPVLEGGNGHPSLIPRIGYKQWQQLKEAGVVDRRAVADLHFPTAELVTSKVDVEKLLGLAVGRPSSDLISDVIPRAKKQIEVLQAAGLETVSDLARLDPLTASVGGFVAPAILNARAALGPEPVYRRHGQDGQVPRADIEVDIDMENVEEGVYLWGALLTHHQGTVPTSEGYHSFATFSQIDEVSEVSVFEEMWAWLRQIRKEASDQGLSFKCYVWHEQAENSQLRRIVGAAADLTQEVDDLIDSEEWVDLMKVFERSWITGGSSSLKVIAPLAGFDWEVEDAGGAMSMVKYDEAVGGDGEAEAWLLDYNRGDVEATAAIRGWLHEYGASWPTVDMR